MNFHIYINKENLRIYGNDNSMLICEKDSMRKIVNVSCHK